MKNKIIALILAGLMAFSSVVPTQATEISTAGVSTASEISTAPEASTASEVSSVAETDEADAGSNSEISEISDAEVSAASETSTFTESEETDISNDADSEENSVIEQEDTASSDEADLEAASETSLSDPRIVADSSMKAGQKVTWDCVWFGSYPQTEIVANASDCGTYGQDWEQSSDNEVNSSLYNQLSGASGWNSNGDITLNGTKYRRVQKSDATYSTSSSSDNYDWSNSSATYHYFRYEPIKWRVLNVDGSQTLLLADEGLDDQKYNRSDTSITWEKSTIRSWLNGYGSSSNTYGTDYSSKNFMDTAFTSGEQNAILSTALDNSTTGDYSASNGGNNTNDKVFLLSSYDLYNTDSAAAYGFYKSSSSTCDEARRSKSSTYAKAMGTYSYFGNCAWWLRSPGYYSYYAAYVYSFGSVNNFGIDVISNFLSVRPALNINLSSSNLYSYAGTVCSDGTINEVGGGNSGGSDEGTQESSKTSVTEEMLFTTENCKYLTNNSYDKMISTIRDDQLQISSNPTWTDFNIVCRTVLANGFTGNIKQIFDGYVTGYTEKKLHEEMALAYMNQCNGSKVLSDNLVSMMSKLSASEKVSNILKKSTATSDELLFIAKQIADGEGVAGWKEVYEDELSLLNDKSNSHVLAKISDQCKEAGRVFTTAEIVVYIVLLKQANVEEVEYYKNLVPEDSGLYTGFNRIEKELQECDIITYAKQFFLQSTVDELLGLMQDFTLKRVVSKVTDVDVATVMGVLEFGNKVTAWIMGNAGVLNLEEWLKASYCMQDQMVLQSSLNNIKVKIINNYLGKASYDTKELQKQYESVWKLYVSCVLQGPTYLENYSLYNAYNEKLQSDVKKYTKKLKYDTYIASCLANANRVYTVKSSNASNTLKAASDSESFLEAASDEEKVVITGVNSGTDSGICMDIPSEIDGCEVVGIDNNVYENNDEVGIVSVPDTVTSIGDSAFSGCNNLTDVFLPDSLLTIGESAFAGCSEMDYLDIPDSVTAIDSTAFDNTDGLTLLCKEDSPAQSVNNDSLTIANREKTVAGLTVKTMPDKTAYKMSESVDLTGLVLTVEYADGTTADINDNYSGFFEDKKLGDNELTVCYGGTSVAISVTVTADECDYTVYYVSSTGEELKDPMTGTEMAGTTITLQAPEIEGFTAEENSISGEIKDYNQFVFVYDKVKLPDVADAEVAYAANAEVTGSAIEPKVTVTYDGKTLTRDVDYTLTYANNTAPGTAEIWITGIGSYTGIKLCNFTITAKKTQNLIVQSSYTKSMTELFFDIPVAGAKTKLTYTSMDESVAFFSKVYENCLIFMHPGTVNIVVTAEETDEYQGATATIKMNIKYATLTKKFNRWPKPLVKKLGDKSFDLLFNEIDTDEGELSFSSSNKKIIKVTSDGVVTPVGIGSASIKVTVTPFRDFYAGSAFSKNLSITVKPGTVSLTKVKAGKKNLTAYYKNVKGGVRYQIQYGLKKNFTGAKTKTTTKVSYKITGLKSKKTYYVRVRAYKKVSGKTYYGAWSKVKTMKTK